MDGIREYLVALDDENRDGQNDEQMTTIYI